MATCVLCGMVANPQLGEMLTAKSINVHLVCLFFTPNLVQKDLTAPTDVLRGFSRADIAKEANRVASNVCHICATKSANLGCCGRKCRKTFHALCGLQNGAHLESQFFNSYCFIHARKMNKTRFKKHTPFDKCLLCEKHMGPFGKLTSVPATCCQKGYFHRVCISKVANEEGINFKCPLCGDSKDDNLFNEVKKRCVFLPAEPHDESKHRPNELCLYCKKFMGTDEQSAFGPCCRAWFHQKCLHFDRCPLCNKPIPGVQAPTMMPPTTTGELAETSDNSMATHSGDVDEDSLTDASTVTFDLSAVFDIKQENLVYDPPMVMIPASTGDRAKRKSEASSPHAKRMVTNGVSPGGDGVVSDCSKDLLVERGVARSTVIVDRMKSLQKRIMALSQRLNDFQTDILQISDDFMTLCEDVVSRDSAEM